MIQLVKLSDAPFHTIQGEGPSIGKSAVFIRFAGCPVECSWCDTKYSWDRDKGKDWEVGILTRYVNEKRPAIVVLTGGEPMAPDVIDDVIAVARAMPVDVDMELETSGYRFSKYVVEHLKAVNLSPKIMSSAKVKDEFRMSLDVAQDWRWKTPGELRWKFPVQNQEDLIEVKEFVKAVDIHPHDVYLMPEGLTKEQIEAKSTWLIDHCKSLGYNFTTRLHVLLWGAKRGV